MAAIGPQTADSASRLRVTPRIAAYVAVLVLAAVISVVRWVSWQRGIEEGGLHGDNEEALGALARALRHMPKASRLPYLLRSVRDRSPGLRYAAIDSLSTYQTPEAAAAIENAFQDSASLVRQRAVETLHVVDHERGLMLLVAAMRDEDSWVRESAVMQLGVRDQRSERGPVRVAPAVDTSAPTAAGARQAAMLADRRCLPTLVRALDDEDEVVARSAVGLLHRLTGRGTVYRTLGEQADKDRVIREWKLWWAASKDRYSVPAAFADVRPIRPNRSDPAPTFELSDIDGQALRLTALRGRPVLINFWGTWCGPCRLEIRSLERLNRLYGSSGLVVIGVAVAESSGEAGLRSWCAGHGLTYRQLLATPELRESYGHIEEVPVSVLIDKQGNIRYRWDGERDFSTYQSAAVRLLSE